LLIDLHRYKAIVFDIGNVLVNFNFNRTFEKWAELTEYSYDFFHSRFQFDQNLYAYEIGQISSREYFNYLTNHFQIDWTFNIFKEGWNYCLIGIPDGIFPILDQIMRKYPLYILSNTNDLHTSYRKLHYSNLFKYFTDRFLSHNLNHHKPEPEIYKKMLGLIQCIPEQVIFFDDVQENVKSARILGIKAFQVKNPLEIQQILIKLDIF